MEKIINTKNIWRDLPELEKEISPQIESMSRINKDKATCRYTVMKQKTSE